MYIVYSKVSTLILSTFFDSEQKPCLRYRENSRQVSFRLLVDKIRVKIDKKKLVWIIAYLIHGILAGEGWSFLVYVSTQKILNCSMTKRTHALINCIDEFVGNDTTAVVSDQTGR